MGLASRISTTNRNDRCPRPAAAYVPSVGEVVFLDKDGNGTAEAAAVITSVSDGVLTVVEGDLEQTVAETTYAADDPAVSGYGLSGSAASSVPMLFSSSAINIREYVESQEGGRFSLLLTDLNNVELPKDQDGSYVVNAGDECKLVLALSAPQGIQEGTYEYPLPSGLELSSVSGSFVVDGVEIGDWVVDPAAGRVVYTFNQNANRYTDNLLSIAITATFTEGDSSIVFDGSITVKVKKPPSEETQTNVNKWGSQEEDTDKIRWEIEITGGTATKLLGTEITDRILTTDNHTYTESDRNAGLKIMAFEYPGGD